MVPIKIAVASGKGGTGKTMVATSLAVCLAEIHSVQILDCDVEAPDTHLFLKPTITENQPATLLLPQIDEYLCTTCGICVDNCVYHALAKAGDKILVFPQLCHGCGSCQLLCPEKAITEMPREIGQINLGETDSGIRFGMGELTISEPMGTPIIHQLKKYSDEAREFIILDSPPGASCSVVATLYNTDYVLLVTEPTPFGLHDLKQMIGVLSVLDIPGGVIINRDGIGDNQVENFLTGTPYPILMRIPFHAEIAQGLARGQVLVDFSPNYSEQFNMLYENIINIVEHRRLLPQS